MEGYESPPALGKSTVGTKAVDWTKMGSSVISLAETVTTTPSSRRSSCVSVDFAGVPLDESCDLDESLNVNTTILKPLASFLLLLKHLEDKDSSIANKAGQSPLLYNHDKILVGRMADRSGRAALPTEPTLCSALIMAQDDCTTREPSFSWEGLTLFGPRKFARFIFRGRAFFFPHCMKVRKSGVCSP
jgi:hypothetical protein